LLVRRFFNNENNMAYLPCDNCGEISNHQGSWDTIIKILCNKCSKFMEERNIERNNLIVLNRIKKLKNPYSMRRKTYDELLALCDMDKERLNLLIMQGSARVVGLVV
jgi:hypothetical protein